MLPNRFVASVFLAALLAASAADAGERRFAYTQESTVLGPDQREVELWTTARLWRSGFFRRFDERVELEFGLASRLQTAFYLNFSQVGSGDDAHRTGESTFEGISSEWKLRLTDPVANAFGSALYLELSANALEAEVEGKLIADKRAGNLLAALNVVGEAEWNWEEGPLEREGKLEVDAGLSWFFTPRLSAGLEVRSVTGLDEDASSTVFAGPVVTWAGESFWATLAAQPQLGALRGATDGRLDLRSHERLELRLLLGFHL